MEGLEVLGSPLVFPPLVVGPLVFASLLLVFASLPLLFVFLPLVVPLVFVFRPLVFAFPPLLFVFFPLVVVPLAFASLPLVVGPPLFVSLPLIVFAFVPPFLVPHVVSATLRALSGASPAACECDFLPQLFFCYLFPEIASVPIGLVTSLELRKKMTTTTR